VAASDFDCRTSDEAVFRTGRISSPTFGLGTAIAQAGTLDDVKAKGFVQCGVNKGLPGFGDEIADRESDASGRRRCARSTELLARGEGALTVAHMISILRDHGADAEGNGDWRPQDATVRTICMHSMGSEPRGQTVGSLVSELRNNNSVHWVTGTAAPCTSIYKPVIIGVPFPNSAALWCRHQAVHHAFADMTQHDLAHFYRERDALEADFRSRVNEVSDSDDREAKAKTVSACWEEADLLEDRWHSFLESR